MVKNKSTMNLNNKKNIFTIILARKNSKGVRNKNIRNFNGKPLIYWTIKSCKKSKYVSKIWVSSDSKKIINFAKKCGVNTILRPAALSSDTASSESGWLHALEIIKETHDLDKIPFILSPQVTSPVRSVNDFDNAINYMFKEKFDSLFSGSYIEDFFIWKNKKKLKPHYSMANRPRRQENVENIYENGSFYIFNTKKFLKKKIRLFGKIGCFIQKRHQSIQIDTLEDFELVKKIHKNY